MARLKRRNTYQGLDKLNVYIEDNSEYSEDYFRVYDLPDIFPGGKSAFLIDGSENLVLNSEVKVEIIDSEGNVVYSEYPQYLEGTSRLVSVWLYEDTAVGPATLTIVGEAKNVPDEWKKYLNVRWKKLIKLNNTLDNDQPIRFYKQPNIYVQEVRKPYLVRSYPTTQIVEYTTGLIRGSFNPRGHYLLEVTGGVFSGRMVGGKLTVAPDMDSISPAITFSPPTYSTYITDIWNENSAIAETPYTFTGSVMDTPTDALPYDLRVSLWPPLNTYNFSYTAYTISYEDSASYTETQNFRSFAKVTIADMGTFSGDVKSVNLFMKSVGSVGTFQLVDDSILEEKELLINSQSIKIDNRIGYFYEQSTIDNYWTSSRSGNQLPATLTYDSTKLLDAMYVSGSLTGSEDYFIVKPKSTTIDFYKNSEYTITSKFYGIKTLKKVYTSPAIRDALSETDGAPDVVEFRKTAILKVYLSGSSFSPTEEDSDTSFGKLIQEIELATQANERGFIYEHNFVADYTGQGEIVFKIEAGEWHFSDISIKTSMESGFSPDVVTFYVPVPDWHRNDTIEFKSEFLDLNSRKARTVATSSEKLIEGGNFYIGGTDNLITGSFFIGNRTGSGLELAGFSGSFFKSIDYISYASAAAGTSPAGFMLWSGSVQRQYTDEYDAVGLELHGGSGSALVSGSAIGHTHALRFRTDTGRLEITGSIYATDGYFSGSVVANQILVPYGDSITGGYDPDNPTSGQGYRAVITPNGYAFFMSGSIAGWQINSWSLSSPDASFKIFGSSSAEGYIISSSRFKVDPQGTVTASNAILDNFIFPGANVFHYIEVNDSNYTQYYYYVTGSVDAASGNEKIYCLLDLRAELGTLGGSTGQFIRLNKRPPDPVDNDDVPLAGILLPRFDWTGSNGAKKVYGGRIIIENAISTDPNFYIYEGYLDRVTIAANHPELESTLTDYDGVMNGCLFNAQANDWYAKLFAEQQSLGLATPTTYSNCFEAKIGGRYDWARSFYDYKLQSATTWDQVQISVLSASSAYIGNLYGPTTGTYVTISGSIGYDGVKGWTNWDVPFFDGETPTSSLMTASDGAFSFRTGSSHNTDELYVSGSGSFGYLHVSGNMDISGNLVVGGIITAQEFHTEYVSASIIYMSGSTKFGDSPDDIHQFTGSIRASGSGPHWYQAGNVGIGTTEPAEVMQLWKSTKQVGLMVGDTTLTADNNFVGHRISTWSDGNVYLDSKVYSGGKIIFRTGAGIQLGAASTWMVVSASNVGIGTTTPKTTLHVTGIISGSQYRYNASTGFFLQAGYANNGLYHNYLGASGTSLWNAGALIWATNTSRFGIGTGLPTASLHIYAGASGVTPVAAVADTLYIEDNANAGVYIMTPDANLGTVVFGTPSDAYGALLRWDYTNNLMTLATARTSAQMALLTGNAVEAVRIDGSGNVGIGTDTPTGSLDVSGSTKFGYRPATDVHQFTGSLRVTGSGDHYILGGNVGIGTASPAATLHVWGTLSASAIEFPAPGSPTDLNLTEVVNDYVLVSFSQSATAGVDEYEVWRAHVEETSSYSLIGIVKTDSIADPMNIIDNGYVISGSLYYRVYAIKNGVRSVAISSSIDTVGEVDDVTDFSVTQLVHHYIIQYDVPVDRRLSYVEIKKDANETAGSLSEGSAVSIYQGREGIFIYEIPDADLGKYHQFWVYSVTNTTVPENPILVKTVYASYWTGSADGTISRNSSIHVTGSTYTLGSLHVTGSSNVSGGLLVHQGEFDYESQIAQAAFATYSITNDLVKAMEIRYSNFTESISIQHDSSGSVTAVTQSVTQSNGGGVKTLTTAYEYSASIVTGWTRTRS